MALQRAVIEVHPSDRGGNLPDRIEVQFNPTEYTLSKGAQIAEMIGPRVFIPARYLPETQLLQFGSTAAYEALGKTRTPEIAERVSRDVRPRRRALDLRVQTAEQAEDDVS